MPFLLTLPDLFTDHPVELQRPALTDVFLVAMPGMIAAAERQQCAERRLDFGNIILEIAT